MALTQLPFVLSWPGYAKGCVAGNQPGQTTVLLNNATYYAAAVFMAAEDMVVSHVGFRTQTGTSAVAAISIETIDPSTGYPSGTLWATNTSAVSGSLAANTRYLVALTAAATIPRGSFFAVKFARDSGTALSLASRTGFESKYLPYGVHKVASTSKTDNPVGVFLGSSSTTFYRIPGYTPYGLATNASFNNTDSAMRGLRFKPPFDCRCVGMSYFTGSFAGDMNALLMSDGGSELSSSGIAVPGLYVGNSTAEKAIFFDNPVNLSGGTWYRAVVEPTSSTDVGITTFDATSSDYRSAYAGGTEHHYTTYTSSGGWVDSSDDVPLIDILIDQMDLGGGGGIGRLVGGGLVH